MPTFRSVGGVSRRYAALAGPVRRAASLLSAHRPLGIQRAAHSRGRVTLKSQWQLKGEMGMSVQETHEAGSKMYVRFAGTLMTVLIAYGVLQLLGVLR
jgi:hypothetical protein